MKIIEGPRYICGCWAIKALIHGKPELVFDKTALGAVRKVLRSEAKPA